jgi:hypothetical protein
VQVKGQLGGSKALGGVCLVSRPVQSFEYGVEFMRKLQCTMEKWDFHEDDRVSTLARFMGQVLCHLRFSSCSAGLPGPHITEADNLLLIIRNEGYADNLGPMFNMFVFLYVHRNKSHG